MPVKRWTFELAAIIVAAAMIAVMAPRLAQMENATSPTGQPMWGDFIAFWSAGKATLEGHVTEIHDRAFLYPFQKTIATDARFFAPYNSPPTFLILACLLALMPYMTSALVFLASSLALYLYAVRKLAPDARALILAVTAPAVIYQGGTLQAALLIAGVVGLALHWLDTRPRLAGSLVALLAIKPHIAVLWPLFLALSGRWRAFWAATAATAAFVVLAGLVFGFDAYLRFFDNLQASGQLISEQRITTPAYASLFGNLLGLGLSQTTAMLAHAASATAGVLLACVLFVRGGREIGGAAMCAATLLVSPYLFFYDFLILIMGAALLGRPRDWFETLALVFAWGAGLTVAVGAHIALPICPVAAWLVLLSAARRARLWAPRPAPAPQP